VKVEKDYEELLGLFNRNKVKYCIVGAYAVAFYARPRYTKDMDILIEPSVPNAERIVKSLVDFGFKSLDLAKEDFCKKNKIIQLGYEPVRIDIITSLKGCSFKEVWSSKTRGTYGKKRVFFVGLDTLIKNKKASNRKQDRIDLDILLSIREMTHEPR